MRSSVPVKGFMIAFSHASKTSPKNPLIASSVCGLVGLLGMLVLALPELDFPLPPPMLLPLREDEAAGMEVYGAKGGKVVDVRCGV